MRFLILLLLFPYFVFTQDGFQVRHINIVDVKTGKIIPNQLVAIKGNKIVTITKDVSVKNTLKSDIDGTNKYLIPGLWDMHYHGGTAPTRSTYFPLMLANGVTGARMMWGTKNDLLLRDSIRQGFIVAPRMVVASPLIDGAHSIFTTAVNTDDATRIPFIIDSLHSLGYDFIKTYEFLPNDVFHAISDYCRSHNIEFAGHTPIGMPIEEASNAGLRSIEHLTGVTKGFSLWEDSLNKILPGKAMHMKDFASFTETFFDNESYNFPFNEKKAEHVAATLRKNNTAVVPSISIYRGYLYNVDSLEKLPELQYFPKSTVKSWYNVRKAGIIDTNYLDNELRNLGFLYTHGVMILAGTDALNSYTVHGFSLHNELEWYVRAGLTPLAALQTATINPALFLHKDKEMGTVEVNKIADLVILHDNPLKDIRNTRAIDAVIVNGRFLSRGELDDMLLKLKTRFQ